MRALPFYDPAAEGARARKAIGNLENEIANRRLTIRRTVRTASRIAMILHEAGVFDERVRVDWNVYGWVSVDIDARSPRDAGPILEVLFAHQPSWRQDHGLPDPADSRSAHAKTMTRRWHISFAEDRFDTSVDVWVRAVMKEDDADCRAVVRTETVESVAIVCDAIPGLEV